MSKESFCFEVLIIDPDGKSEIQSPNSLLHGLLSTDKLWSDAKQGKEKDAITIKDNEILVKIKPSSVLDDIIESAFMIQIKSSDFGRIEKFRYPFLIHLRNRLNFTHIRLLTDDVSTKISNDLYPIVNELENSLRRYISKFFTQKIGVDWWEKAVPDKVIEKTKIRKTNETLFSTLLQTDLTLIDFDDLGNIIYKHKLGFNRPQNLADRILSIKESNLEVEFKRLKTDLDSNYNRFFKENFKNQNFEKKWKELFKIRNKVAHNNLFVQDDYIRAKELYEGLTSIIKNAESKIDEFKFTVEEQEAIRESKADSNESSDIQSSVKVIGKVDTDEFESDVEYQEYDIITQEEFINELERAEKAISLNNHLTYVGLKSFVTKVLGAKGYAYGPTYALANILKDKGIVSIYEQDDASSYYPVKAIKLTK